MQLFTIACVIVVSVAVSSLVNPNKTFLDDFTQQSILFYCDEGATFIERAYVCDGKIDCPDGRDEMFGLCNGTNPCNKTEFKCVNDGTGSELRCVRLDFTCDGEYDCYDGSDELNCLNTDCQGFECDNGYCAASNSECDGFPDCQDHSDENKTMCALRNCDREQFRCDSGQCVDIRGLCNGITSCADGSDESSNLCRQGSRSLHCPDRRRFMCAPGTCLQMNWLCDVTGHFQCQQSEIKFLNYTNNHSTTTTTTTTTKKPHPIVLGHLGEDLADYEFNKDDYRDFSFSSSEDDV